MTHASESGVKLMATISGTCVRALRQSTYPAETTALNALSQ